MDSLDFAHAAGYDGIMAFHAHDHRDCGYVAEDEDKEGPQVEN
jgi:hypothetical protein